MTDLKVASDDEVDLEISEDSDEDSSDESTSERSIVYIHNGLKFDPADAEIVTKANITNVVVLAGHPEGGKTTLFASIYERFQKGGFAGCEFASSLTLMDFEDICHESRTNSNRSVPKTPRTNLLDGEKFLHLAVKKSDDRKDLLMADINGELFIRAKDSHSECNKIISLKRADVLGIVFDMGRICQPSSRHITKADCLGLLKSCIQYGVLSQFTKVQLIFSKWDMVDQLEEIEKQGIIEYVDDVSRNAQSILKEAGEIEIHKISSKVSYDTNNVALEALFLSWLKKSKHVSKSVLANFSSEFGSYGNKVFQGSLNE